jgi:hypothetical protein
MGRTSAILTTDSTVLDEQLLISNPNSLEFCQELGLLESARAFSFLERTVNEVYKKQTVPLGLLYHISHELQEASSNLPSELRTNVVSNSPAESCRWSQQHILRNASVACIYWSLLSVFSWKSVRIPDKWEFPDTYTKKVGFQDYVRMKESSGWSRYGYEREYCAVKS